MSRSRNGGKPLLLPEIDAEKPRPSLLTSKLTQLDETITLFDEIMRLLDDSSLPRQIEGGLPSEPLPSLLQQCEQIATQAESKLPGLLIAFPGLPPLNLNWWRDQAPGIEFHRLPDPCEENKLRLSEQIVRTMQHELAREGRELFFLATPFASYSKQIFDPLRKRILVCHPWRAYAMAGIGMGFSLNGFCEALSTSLSGLQKAETLRFEDIADEQEERVRVLLGQKTPHRATGAQDTQPIDYFGGAPAYEALCGTLGYDPGRLLGIDPEILPAAIIPLTAPEGSGALLSWFLPRLATLLPPAKITNTQILLPQIDTALTAKAAPEALDALFATLEREDCALAMLLAAAHFTRKGETLLALGLVTEALDEAPPHAQSLIALGASLYLDLNRGSLALAALTSGLRQSGVLKQPQIASLDTALYKGLANNSNSEHGHALLVNYLRDAPPLPLPRKQLMIEIGTTRENVPDQGSTRKLAQLCADLGLDFVTVDMDPSNSRRARRMFKRLGLPFKAITAKGEDYLAAHPGPIDYVFLDAYDFDHGKHSEQRQSRYERYLGNRISDADCHQMHLDCAHSLLDKLAENGLICFDDTWIDAAGNWSAKGTTAMPFLLANGFEIVNAENSAALLRRN